MASNVKIQFEIEGIKGSVSSIDELQKALKDAEKQAGKTENSLEDVADAAKGAGKQSEEAAKNAEGFTKILDEAFGGLGTKIKEVGGSLLQLGKSAVTSFKSAILGANAMKTALIATGIGAIVVALGVIAAYWDDIVGAISGVSSDQKKLLADTEATSKAAQDHLDATSATENTLKLSGKSEREIRDLKIQQTNEAIVALENQLVLQKEQSKAQVEALERNKTIAQNVIRFLTFPVTLLLTAVDALTAGLAKVGVIAEGTNLEEGFSGGLAKLIFDPEEAKTLGDETQVEIEGQLAKMKNTRDGYKLQNQKEEADARQKRIDDAKTEADQIAADKKIADEKAAADKKAADEKALADAQIIKDALQAANLASIEDTFERARAELQIQQDLEIAKVTAAGATAEQLAIINKKYTNDFKKLKEEEKKYNKEMEEAKKAAVLNTASAALGAIISVAGEGSAIGKAAAVAQTTIDTYQSAQAAYKSVVGIPVVGPTLAPIAAGVAVVGGLMNVKKILSVKTPGNSGGGGGAPSISAPSIPAFNPTAALEGALGSGQTGDNNITLGEQTGSTSPMTVKAYVVSSDMTKSQEADKKINDLARL